jgi:DNA-binding transcriptional ArsR family regulator
VSHKRAEALNRLFRALASAPRREILRLAARKRCAVTQFAAQLEMSQPAVSKHVRILVDAELLSKTREGRYRWCRLNRGAFQSARESIEELRGTVTPKKNVRRRATQTSSTQKESKRGGVL